MHKFRNRLITLLLVIAVIIALLMLVPTLLGFDRYVIESGSMSGTIDKGSVVYAKPTGENELRVGDIITYSPPPDSGVTGLITHRIYSIQQPGHPGGRPNFRTKGDANETPDPWVFELNDGEAGLEKAHLPYLGYLYLVLAIPWVRLAVIVVPALLIVALTLRSLWVEAGREAAREREKLRAERAGGPPLST